MDNQAKLMAMLIKVFSINSIQALHLSDIMLNPDVRVSYTYMPSNVRRSLWPLIERQIVTIFKAPVEGETQVYEWMGLRTSAFERFLQEMKS